MGDGPADAIETRTNYFDDTVLKKVSSVELESRKWKEEVLNQLRALEDKIIGKLEHIEDKVDDMEMRMNSLETQIFGPFLERYTVVDMQEAMQARERRKKGYHREFQLISVCKVLQNIIFLSLILFSSIASYESFYLIKNVIT